MPPTTVHLVNEFSAALHYGPGPHPDGTPQSVHGGGAGKPATRPAIRAGQLVNTADGREWRVRRLEGELVWIVDSHDPDRDKIVSASDLTPVKKGIPSTASGDMAWLARNSAGFPHDGDGKLAAKRIMRFMGQSYPGATAGDLRQMYDYTDAETGLRAETDFIETIGTNNSAALVSGLIVHGYVYDRDGKTAGSFTRKLDDRGNVEHNKFVMGPDYRQQGFGSRFYQNSEAVYRRIGVKEVRLQANMAVGGYAWARMGFDFAPGFNGAEDKQAVRRYSNYARALWQEETHGAAPFPEVQHAWEIAALTTPSGRRVGKETLLGSNWSGIKRLTPGSPGVQVGDLYYATKTKKGVF